MGHRTTAAAERLENHEHRLNALEDQLLHVNAGRVIATAGELMRRRRRELGHTQADAARSIGVNQSTVSKWERGDRIGWDHAANVAAYLGITPAALLATTL